jgi:hypothetical protein
VAARLGFSVAKAYVGLSSTLRKLQEEVIRPSVRDYPPFLYKDGVIKADALEGLFRSDILIKVWCVVG